MLAKNRDNKAVCIIKTDKSGREIASHGTNEFPVACYKDDLRDETIPWHWHDEIELVILDSGEALVNIGGESRFVKAGEGYIANSGALHSMQIGDCANGVFRSVVFHYRFAGDVDGVLYRRYIAPVVNNKGMPGVFLKGKTAWHKEILEEIDRIHSLLGEQNDGCEFEIREGLSKILFALYKNLPREKLDINEKELRNAERIKLMLSFIAKNFAESITAEDIAKAASISESEALRCFKATINTTPIQYLKEYRIQRASELLGKGGYKVNEAAQLCGFGDMSYFAKEFKRFKGVSPREYNGHF